MQNGTTMRHFEAVIVLAEEMHFGRAAQRLGLTQSGMTRRIQSAEREAKATLFARSRSAVELTDAGRTYVEHARVAIAFGERAMHSAKAFREGASTILEIGKSPDIDPILVEVMYSIRLPLFPNLEINVHSESSSDLAHGLMSATLDVALITQPESNAKLTMTKLAETQMHIVLPSNHFLASKNGVTLTDLRDERWIIYQQRVHPLLYERIMRRVRDENIHPKRIDRILYADEAEQMLLANRGVAFLTKASALKLHGDRLIAKPLNEPSLCVDEWIVARADDPSRFVSEFVRAFVTRTALVLQPSQMILPIDKTASAPGRCTPL
jgi:DNA-binding transcriptional LysR family regulator